METVSVSAAKPRLGKLIDRALAGEPVLIRKGSRLVQLLEYVVPEPIPMRPVGYFKRKPEDYAIANRAPANHPPLR